MGMMSREHTGTSTRLQRLPEPPQKRGPLRRALRWLGFACILAGAIVFGGFLRFADHVTTMMPPDNPRADAIIVLTGGYQRIDQAVELLEQGAGQRLLISGVHPTTTPTQIRRMTRSSAHLFSCCVDIGYDALDTIGNAEEATNWIHRRGYKHIIVVTNNYHMPRSLVELSHADPATDFIPYPVVNSDLKTGAWFSDRNAMRVMLAEYAKLLLAGMRNLTGFGRHSGLRSEGIEER